VQRLLFLCRPVIVADSLPLVGASDIDSRMAQNRPQGQLRCRNPSAGAEAGKMA